MKPDHSTAAEVTHEPTTSIRPGVIVDPVERLDADRLSLLHQGALRILSDHGLVCFNEEASSIFSTAGCPTERLAADGAWRVRLPAGVVERATETAPSRVLLGAREPANTLELDAEVPRVYFGTGSETNVFLETEMVEAAPTNGGGAPVVIPRHVAERGSVRRLADSARLCNALDSIDFFIRNVNVQDPGIDATNKDVNVFFASLRYMTKHVQAGLNDLSALDQVVRMGELVAGGPEPFRAAPPISFIACLVKSPLQMVDDTTAKVIEIARRGLPLVVSSSPQGGSTAPIQEEGMVAMINAEILAGITLTQLVRPGTPVLYGAVPVRARLDTLHDLYGAPEFIHYNLDCIQLARRYRIPCYSTAGVGDSGQPGLPAMVEKTFSHLAVAQGGAQYIHYAFGLLDRTGTFSPVQAIIDDANVALVKEILRTPSFNASDVDAAVAEVGKTMGSPSRLFARQIRKQMRRGVVSSPYRLETEGGHDRLIQAACDRLAAIRATPGSPLNAAVTREIQSQVSGLLPLEHFHL